jgi:hypothetical protein
MVRMMTRFRVFEPVFAMATCFRTPLGPALLQQSRLRPTSSLAAPRALSDSHPPPAANSLIWTPASSLTNLTDRILLQIIARFLNPMLRSQQPRFGLDRSTADLAERVDPYSK